MKYCYKHARKASRSPSKDVIAKIDNVANCKHGSVIFLKANEVLAGSKIGQEITQSRTTRGMQRRRNPVAKLSTPPSTDLVFFDQ